MGMYDQIIENMISWAKACNNVKTVLMIGSQARVNQGADQYSDLDIIMIVDNPEHFLFSEQWLVNIGEHKISFTEDTIDGGKERRVLFDGALDVDFVLRSEEDMRKMVQSHLVAELLIKGYRVLVDKIGITDDLIVATSAKPQPYSPPPESEFTNLVNDFWYHAVWSTKKLLRGELWSAKSCIDCYMKWQLQKVIEWHVRAVKGGEYDTWHGGRFLDMWADSQVKEELPKLFAHYNKEDIRRALLATMDLFRSLAVEVAEKLVFEYPKTADESASAWVEELFTNSSK